MSKRKLLYIIYNPQLEITKIGITDNIVRRRRQLECSSGVSLELYYTTKPLVRAALIEKSLHSYFNNNRQEGEYFAISPEIIKEKLLFIIGNLSRIYTDL